MQYKKYIDRSLNFILPAFNDVGSRVEPYHPARLLLSSMNMSKPNVPKMNEFNSSDYFLSLKNCTSYHIM